MRYLKFSFLNHHGLEYYCTLSQIRVHGTTLLAAAQEDLQHHALELEEIHALIGDSNDNDDEDDVNEEKAFKDTGEEAEEEGGDKLQGEKALDVEVGHLDDNVDETVEVSATDKQDTESSGKPTDSDSIASPDLSLPMIDSEVGDTVVAAVNDSTVVEATTAACDQVDSSNSDSEPVEELKSEVKPVEAETVVDSKVDKVEKTAEEKHGKTEAVTQDAESTSSMKALESDTPQPVDSVSSTFQRAIGRLMGTQERANDTNQTNTTLNTTVGNGHTNSTNASVTNGTSQEAITNATNSSEKDNEVEKKNITSTNNTNSTSDTPNDQTLKPHANTSSESIRKNSTDTAKSDTGSKRSSNISNSSKASTVKNVDQTVKVDRRVEACLEGLNFSKFKEKVHAKVAAGKGNSKYGVDGSQQDRIFKTMMDMVKSLEVGSSIFELYVMRLHVCYSSILEDVYSQHQGMLTSMQESNHTVNTSLQLMQSDLDRYTPAGYAYRAQINAVQVC